MKNIIYLYDYFAFIISNSLNTEMHAHLFNQLTISLNREPMRVQVEGSTIIDESLFIPSLCKHQFLDEKGSYLTILIDHESIFELNDFLEHFNKEFPQGLSEKPQINKLKEIMNIKHNSDIDGRIEQAVDIIKETDNLQEIRSLNLSNELNISESRFLHLFKKEKRVTFRKYILWQKLKRAMNDITNSKDYSFTDIAYKAGFTDSAHLANVVKSSFGLSLSDIVNNSQFLQD